MEDIKQQKNQYQSYRLGKNLRLVAWILCLCIVGGLLLNVTYVISHYSHHCSGQQCSVCQKIDASIDNIISIGKRFLAGSFLIFLSIGWLQTQPIICVYRFDSVTLVQRKIRLNI
jgi:hypothetical protein